MLTKVACCATYAPNTTQEQGPMAKVKSLYEDQRERRFDEIRNDIMLECHLYGWHPDDDSDKIEEKAADQLEREMPEDKAPPQIHFGSRPPAGKM
jgi:hypothetical protein